MYVRTRAHPQGDGRSSKGGAADDQGRRGRRLFLHPDADKVTLRMVNEAIGEPMVAASLGTLV